MSDNEPKEPEKTRGGLKIFETQSGFEVKEVYGPGDVRLDYEKDLGEPGSYPFTRGLYPRMYRERLWAMEQPIGWGIEEAGERWKSQIQRGLSAAYLFTDEAIKPGIDPDHPLAKNGCGIGGPCIFALPQAEKFLEGVSLEDSIVELHEAEATWSDACWLAMLMAIVEKRGVSPSKLRGSIINDPILNHAADLLAADFWPFEIPYKLHGDIVDYVVRHLTGWRSFVPCGNNYHEAGLDAVQQVAFVIGEAKTYMEFALERGLRFETVANSFALSFAASFDFLETVAKLRAARRIWAKIARERFGAMDPHLCRARIAVRSGATTMGARNPLANIARIALQGLAAAMGGASSIEYCSFDEALSIPTSEASMLNLTINGILARETRAALVADPLGGSYYVEWLTNKIEDEVTKLLAKIDGLGGMLAALESGWLRKEIKREGLERAKRIEDRRWPFVDENEVIVPEEEIIPIKVFNYGGERRKINENIIASCKELKETRDVERVRRTLEDLRQKTARRENLLYPMIEAFKAYATRGEILGTIREGFGYGYDPFNIVQRPAFLSGKL